MLNALTGLIAFLHAHPRESAIISLALALAGNWILGTLDALVRGEFSFQRWPGIISSQLASTEVKVIGGLMLTAAVTAYSQHLFTVPAQQLTALVIDQALNAAAAAAALYSAALWREDLTQLHDIGSAIGALASGKALPARRNGGHQSPVAKAA